MKDMSRRFFLKTSALGLAASGFTSAASATADEKKKWNFVLILIDDMGWTDLGCYGSSLYETPHIDELCRRGMKFTDAYAACPVCSPTRASIMTGKYPARINLTEWVPGLPPKQSEKIMAPYYEKELPLGEITIAEALKPEGYVTASIGKWHLGGKGYYPEDQGFDVNIGGTHSGMPAGYFYPEWLGEGIDDITKGNPPIKAHPGTYLTDKLTEEAEKFIEVNREKPFFLYLTHYAVHTPIEAKPEKIEKYRQKIGPNSTHTNPVYAGMVESVDECVGRVMMKLESLGIADRTVILFTSDNGGLMTSEGNNTPATSNLPLRAGKGHVYEGGIREPMIVCWPGMTPSRSVCTEPVISCDFFPTILDIAGIKNSHGNTIDGVSLVPLLKGTESLGREALFWHYPHYSPQWATPAGAIRKGDYKLIEFFEDGRLELYNIVGDIGEQNNLLAFKYTHIENPYQKIADELYADLKKWRIEVDAKMPVPNPDYMGK